MSVCSVCNKKAYPNELEAGADLPTHKACFKCSNCSVRLTLKTYKRVGNTLFCQQHLPQQNHVEKGTATKPPATNPSSPTAAATAATPSKPASGATNVRAPSPGPAKPSTTTPAATTTAATTATTTAASKPTTPTTTTTTPAKTTAPAATPVTTTTPVKTTAPAPAKVVKVEPKPEPVEEPDFGAPPPPPPAPPADFFDDVDTKTLKRLEDLTARLERKSGNSGSGSNKKETLDAAISRLAALVNRAEAIAARGPAAPSSGGSSGSSAVVVAEFGVYVDGTVKPFLALSDNIGGDVQKMGELLLAVVNAEKSLLEKAATQKKPNQADFQNLLGPLSAAITEVNNFKEKKQKE